MKKILKKTFVVLASIAVVLCLNIKITSNASAGSFSVSPMNDNISLTPGETYQGSFKVTNPSTSAEDFAFTATISTFNNSDEDGNVKVDVDETSYNEMTNWITLSNNEGTISPNNTQTIYYTISVPLNAPGGGQYAAIIVQSATGSSTGGTINIDQQMRIAYLIYANVAGETVHEGTVNSVDVPGFLLDGNITGTASITNNGNVHDGATYKLQVFPLFSNEEVYTNEEDPDTALIMPEATIVKTSAWDQTPSVGIFNVKYTVEFNGETATVEKMVVKCPIWLLFVIIFAIIAIIVWLILKSKSHKKSTK